MTIHGIIYAVFRPDGKEVYVGRTVRPIAVRWAAHMGAARRGIQTAFARAIRKYGAENMVVRQVDYAVTEDELNWKERRWIRLFAARTRGYNLVDGGEGKSGWVPTEQALQNMRAAQQGRVTSPETRLKLSVIGRGRTKSPETRRRMAEANRTRHFSQETRRKISTANRNRSLEVRQKLSAAGHGKSLSLKHRQRISDGRRHVHELRITGSNVQQGPC